MVLVRQVARPDAAGSAGCSSRCCWFGRLLVPMVVCFALWSCFPMCRVAGCVSRCCWFGRLLSRRCLALRCGVASRWCFAPSLLAVTPRWCLALHCGAASRWCFAPFLLAVASRWCHRLPRRISTQRLPRSGNLFRTDFRFAPSLPQRFACGSSHSRGEGTEKVSEHSVITQRTIYNYLVVCWIFCIFK